MADVFLSYAKVDQDRVRKLVSFLERQGYSVWWDLDIPPTGSFDDYIRQRLNDCKCAIVVWSRDSARSNYVRGEARAALKAGKLVSVVIDPWRELEQDVPLDFHSLEYADVSQWNEEPDGHEIQLVLRAVESLSAKAPQQPSQTGDSENGRSRKPFAPLIPLAVGLAAVAGSIVAYQHFRQEQIPPAKACRLLATIQKLNPVPTGVSIAYLEAVGKSVQTFTVSPAGESVLDIEDATAAPWQLNIIWEDGVRSEVGPYAGCPTNAHDKSQDGRANVALRSR
jgi:hypothetical protein